jgi:hypothetical protein
MGLSEMKMAPNNVPVFDTVLLLPIIELDGSSAMQVIGKPLRHCACCGECARCDAMYYFRHQINMALAANCQVILWSRRQN